MASSSPSSSSIKHDYLNISNISLQNSHTLQRRQKKLENEETYSLPVSTSNIKSTNSGITEKNNNMKKEKKHEQKKQIEISAEEKETHGIKQHFILVTKMINLLMQELEQPFVDSTVITRDHFKDLESKISHSVFKLAVSLTNDPAVPLKVLNDMTTELLENLTNFQSVLRSLMSTAGKTLKAQLIEYGSTLLKSVRSVIINLQKRVIDKKTVDIKSSSENLKLIAKVEKDCKALLHIPLTNESAVGKKFMSCLSQIKDVKHELEEISLGDGPALKIYGLDGTEVFDDIESDEFTEEEYRRVPVLVKMCKLIYALVKKIYQFILKCEGQIESDGHDMHINWLEKQVITTWEICRVLDECGSEIYPPQIQENLDKAFKNLVTIMENSISHFESHEKFKDIFPLIETKHKQWIGAMRKKKKKNEQCIYEINSFNCIKGMIISYILSIVMH